MIAFNFKPIVYAQHFETNMIDPISCTGMGCFHALPDNCKPWVSELGYAKNGQPNFTVYTDEEYERLPNELANGIKIFIDLFNQTSEIAAEITAQHAPEHIRKFAEKVGAFTYQFDSLAAIVNDLYKENWLQNVNKTDKPALCLIKHIK